MKKEESSYIYLLALHAFLGVFIFILPFLSKIYTLIIVVFGIYYIEVFLRMTGGGFLNEFGKYTILVFMFLGMIYSGFSKSAILYWIFLGLLIPGVILATLTFDLETDIRKAIAFNLSGPVCLGISAIYCYQRQISFDRLLGIITAFSLPLVSLVVYLFLYTPSVRAVVTGTQSNFETSGGFGPNQVATILGLGIFIFFVQLVLNSSSKLLQIVNTVFVLIFAFRGIVTFSRGGVLTAIMMVFIFLLVLYYQANVRTRPKIGLIIILSFVAALGVWGYSSLQTGGLINKRYANQDARGREKKSQLTGRETLIATEMQMFWDNPILGVGVGRNKEIREKETGIISASHNEITRMLAEHGSLGLIDLLILGFTPLVLFMANRQNIFALSFLVFWLLTINHAAMRLAAPAFVYALSLLKVYTIEKPAIHRE
jgi:O-antigen ligase